MIVVVWPLGFIKLFYDIFAASAKTCLEISGIFEFLLLNLFLILSYNHKSRLTGPGLHNFTDWNEFTVGSNTKAEISTLHNSSLNRLRFYWDNIFTVMPAIYLWNLFL